MLLFFYLLPRTRGTSGYKYPGLLKNSVILCWTIQFAVVYKQVTNKKKKHVIYNEETAENSSPFSQDTFSGPLTIGINWSCPPSTVNGDITKPQSFKLTIKITTCVSEIPFFPTQEVRRKCR